MFLVAWASVGSLGCGSKKPNTRLSYGQNAQAAYKAALEEFQDDDCVEAEPAFEQVSRKYPYSRYAALAELRLADCMLQQEQYAEGIAAYQEFLRRRPTHKEVPYARFKIAEAYFKQVPATWLLSPPAHEKDQANTHRALGSIRGFIKQHPKDGRVPLARRMEREAVSLLAQHEHYAARFYLSRGHTTAAILRLEALRESYKGATIEPEALLLLAELYADTGAPKRARNVLRELVQRHPRSAQARAAQRKLAAR